MIFALTFATTAAALVLAPFPLEPEEDRPYRLATAAALALVGGWYALA
ncbi:MAG: hypothetical protein ACO3RX_00120 [Chthoniobacterales bacterium]